MGKDLEWTLLWVRSMMVDVSVRLEDYVLGARVATDLVNTAPEVRHSTGEALTDRAALDAFLADHGFSEHGITARVGVRDLADVLVLRTRVRAVLDDPHPVSAVRRAAALTADTGAGPTLLSVSTGRWEWATVPRSGVGVVGTLSLVVGLGLLGVLRTLGHDRFRQCAAPDCAGAFADTSRAGRRRFCDPPVCGNRINVAAYRARRRAERP